MATKGDKNFNIIMESIDIVCSIQCLKCNKKESDWQTDEHYFAKKLINDGWTVKSEKVLCPDCTKKVK